MAPENYFCQVRRCDTPGERVKVQWFGDLVGFKNKLTLLDTKGLCLLIFKFILFYLLFFFFCTLIVYEINCIPCILFSFFCRGMADLWGYIMCPKHEQGEKREPLFHYTKRAELVFQKRHGGGTNWKRLCGNRKTLLTHALLISVNSLLSLIISHNYLIIISYYPWACYLLPLSSHNYLTIITYYLWHVVYYLCFSYYL